MSSFADSFELPFVRSVNGTDYTLRLLTTRDLLPWLAEVTQHRKDEFTRLMPDNVKPVEKYNAQRAIALMECSPDDLRPLVSTGPGTIRVLELAGTKAGITDQQELAAFVDGGSVAQNMRDAVRVSALFTAEQYAAFFLPAPPDDTNRASDPNDPAGDNPV